ncbi:MAG TPA: DMT family transporter, partial [Patescibacteria group bacterium]
MSILPSNRLKAYGFLLLNAAFWGFAAPIIKYSLNYTTPNLFLLYRFLIATILFLPFYLIYRKKIKTKTKPFLLFSLALLGTPLTLLPLFYGLNLTTSIEGSILEASSPLFIILGGLLFLREKMSLKEWLGFGITLIGTSLLTFEPVITGHS